MYRRFLCFVPISFMHTEQFTEMDIIGNGLVMFVIGVDPISDSLSFCLYELAMNKQIQDKLRHHIYTTKEKHKGECSNDYLVDLHYVDMVILGIVYLG